MNILDKINQALNEAENNHVVCPHCGREFDYTNKQTEDKLNQIILDNKGKGFLTVGWNLESPMDNRYVLYAVLSYDSATQAIKGTWHLVGKKDFFDKSGTPNALSNMQSKQKLPDIFIKTTPALRAKLADSRKTEAGPFKVLKSKLVKILNRVDTGLYHKTTTLQYKNFFGK